MKGVAGGNAKKAKKELENLIKGSDEYEEKLKEIKKWDAESNSNDNKQLPLKILANSFFGSFGSNVFPWSEIQSAEKITCIGRQSLRLMTHWFGERGYKAIVGDSFLYDTPIYIKYKDSNIIDIKTIKEVFDSSKCEIDMLGREYDNSEKPYQVLCRTGWVDVTYVYRHKTNKDIHRVSFKDGLIDVTSDHSLFNDKQEKLHSKNVIANETKLEMANIDFNSFIETNNNITNEEIIKLGIELGLSESKEKRIPTLIINSSLDNQKLFLKSFMLNNKTNNENNKVLNAGIKFLLNRVK